MIKEKDMDQTKIFGRILSVNLTDHQSKFLSFTDQACGYLGGRGFNVWYLYHHLQPPVDPLSPENILLFSCGLLSGSSAPSAARLHINALSPLTHILGSSNIGGYAGAWLRTCNISSIIVSGKSDIPVYLYINDTGVQICDAKDLWRKDTFETQDQLKKKHPRENIRILTIGPAGENRVRFAAILSGKDHAAGRTGMGAVMGSKNLKAIVIAKGAHRHFPADTPQKKAAVKTYTSAIRSASEFKFYSTYGGAGYIEWVNDMGVMSRKNYSRVGMADIRNIDGRKLEKKAVKSSGCFKCPVQCKADLVMDNAHPEMISTRPEFEPILNLGPKCGLDDLEAIVRLDTLCTRLGVDSTSAASGIAFAMDIYERGLLPKKWLQAPGQPKLDLSWGNAATMEKLLYQMVEDKGLGSLLRLGVREAARQLGGEARAYAIHVKGLELTAYHPKAIMGTALGYAVSTRGGDYNNVYASLEYSWTREQAEKEFGTRDAVDIKSSTAKGYVIKKAVIANILVDSIGLCKVPVFSLLRSFDLDNEVTLINALTGLNVSRESLFRAGEKIAAIEKWFNLCHGKKDMKDELPELFFTENTEGRGGEKDGKTVEPRGLTHENFTAMLDEYYRAMGWDKNGIPPEPEKLIEQD